MAAQSQVRLSVDAVSMRTASIERQSVAALEASDFKTQVRLCRTITREEVSRKSSGVTVEVRSDTTYVHPHQ